MLLNKLYSSDIFDNHQWQEHCIESLLTNGYHRKKTENIEKKAANYVTVYKNIKTLPFSENSLIYLPLYH